MGPPPHPLAGQSGEGPPIAPANWKWRAGNRLSDMYFYSPSGRQFRSRPELASYLKTLHDPPDASLFIWRVTGEVLKAVPQNDAPMPRPAGKRKAPSPLAGGSKRPKASVNPVSHLPASKGRPSTFAGQSEQKQRPTSAIASGTKLLQKGTSPMPRPHRYGNGADTETPGKRGRKSVPHSFKTVLAVRSSFKWLYDPDTLDKFLEEARRLKQRSAAEINELRKGFLERNFDMNNMCKYPNSVLRVFVSLLRNEEPPAVLGKAELADLCVNWRCKKRHYWCLLEANRVGSAPMNLSKMEDVNRGKLGQSRGSSTQGVVTELKDKFGHQHDEEGGREKDERIVNPAAVHDFQLVNGSGRVADEGARTAELPQELQCETSRTPGNTTESPLSSHRSGPEILPARTSEGLASTSIEEQERTSFEAATNASSGNVAGYTCGSSVLLEAVVGILHSDEGTRSQVSAAHLDEDIMGGAHENAGRSEGIEEVIIREQEPTSERVPSCLGHGGDNVGLSRSSEHSSQRGVGESSQDFNPLTNTGEIQRSKTFETTLQSNGEVTSTSQPASDLDGESIIVITGFKSSTSRGIVSQREEAAQLEGAKRATATGRVFRAEHVQGSLQRGARPGNVAWKSDVANLNFREKVSGKRFSDSTQVRVAASHTSRASLTVVGVPAEVPGIVKQEPICLNDYRVNVRIGSIPHFDRDTRAERIKVEYITHGVSEESPKVFHSGRESSACWCKICDGDFFFCRGCMCSFCKKGVQSGEDWMVVKCVCNHICHIDCAVAANAAGVVKERELDGELSCPSCTRKVDLWPFFQKRFDMLVSLSEAANVNCTGLEKLLLQAVRLLKGTEKRRYKSLERLALESYELLKKFPFLVLVQQLLHGIRDELHARPNTGGPDPESKKGELDAHATPERMDMLRREEMVKESLDTAKSERLILEQAVDRVQKAYAEAINRRQWARSAWASEVRTSREPHYPKHEISSPVTQEILLLQQAKVDQELQRLWDMRKFEARDFMTFSALDASAGAWLEGLKSQRVIVDSVKAELMRLKESE